MKILIACDKFKGSLSSEEVAAAIGRGIGKTLPKAKVISRSIADGGEGFMDAMVTARNGEKVRCEVRDALGSPVEAEYGIFEDEAGGKKTAVIEMAQASGLWRIAQKDRKILKSATWGTGEMIRHAIENHQVSRILIGIGGSATNDGGVGMAQALGVKFFSAEGKELSGTPESLQKIETVDYSGRIELPEITVACDVDSPLLGETGATAVFGFQKGATQADKEVLEAGLKHLMDVENGQKFAEAPGAGAAGGLGYGLMKFANAQLSSGFTILAEAIHLKEMISEADLVITGEGGLDSQSLSGKGPLGVATMAKEAGKPVVALAGFIEEKVDWTPYFDFTAAVADFNKPIEELIANAAHFVEELSTRIAVVFDPLVKNSKKG